MRTWENKLQTMLNCPPPKTTTTPAPTTQPSGYVVPVEFGIIDAYDYLTDNPDDSNYMDYYAEYYPNHFDVGDVVHLSTRCTNDFDFSVGRTNFGIQAYKCLYDANLSGSEEDWDSYIQYMCRMPNFRILQYSIVDPANSGEYLTFLNCPQCGCTEGQNDAVKITDDRSQIGLGNTRSNKNEDPREHFKMQNNV